MSVLLDEDTIVLEGLDFAPSCVACEHTADHIIKCRSCQHTTLLCTRHLIRLTVRCEAEMVVTVTYQACGFTGATLDDVAVVIDL